MLQKKTQHLEQYFDAVPALKQRLSVKKVWKLKQVQLDTKRSLHDP